MNGLLRARAANDVARARNSLRNSNTEKLRVFLRTRLFRSRLDLLVTCVAVVAIVYPLLWVVNWAFVEGIWTKENAELCKTSAGACWAVIDARYRLILFGLYPYDEHWRSALGCVIAVFVIALSCSPFFWKPLRLATIWLIGFGIFYGLMHGGVFGLPIVPSDNWGGLALTIFIYISVIVMGMPLAIILLLARRSTLPAVSGMATVTIDVIRTLPLLTILFTAAVIAPLALPVWMQGNKLSRVIVAFAFFFACYQAENFRGGWQSIPSGQGEAAKALGLGNLQIILLILLPQAFRASLPSTMNQVVITFKDTSVIIIIGFFDVLASGRAAYGSGEWSHTYVEVSLFLAAIYFVFVFTLSRYGAYLARRMRVG